MVVRRKTSVLFLMIAALYVTTGYGQEKMDGDLTDVSHLSISSNSKYKGLKSYQSWGDKEEEDYHAWEGEKTALFSKEKFSDDNVNRVLEYLDTCFSYYQKFGQTRWPIISNKHFGYKGTLAIVERTCGAGCGAGGKAEIQVKTFEKSRLYHNTIKKPAVWGVGFYEFGRQSGEAFPFFYALHHNGGYLTSAFPEFISTSCRNELGESDEYIKDLAEKVGRSDIGGPLGYKEGFDRMLFDFEGFENLDENDRAIKEKIFTPYHVIPRQLLTSVFYYLFLKYGEDFTNNFFAEAKKREANKQLPKNAHETACQIMGIAKAADPLKPTEIEDYLIETWKFPNDCEQSRDQCDDDGEGGNEDGVTSAICEETSNHISVGVRFRVCESSGWSGWGSCKPMNCDDGYFVQEDRCVKNSELESRIVFKNTQRNFRIGKIKEITVELVDASNSILPNKKISMSVKNGVDKIKIIRSLATTNSEGKATFRIKGIKSGNAYMEFKLLGSELPEASKKLKIHLYNGGKRKFL